MKTAHRTSPWIALLVGGAIATGAFAEGAADTPHAAAPVALRPFPQHVAYAAGAIKPSKVTQAAMDAKVASQYALWKANYLRTDGGEGAWIDYNGRNCTVSEAHGYGMVLAAYMGDKDTLDSMYGYFTAHPSIWGPHLMAWKQRLTNGKMIDVADHVSATDGDLDVAFALLLADAQWGSSGSIDYHARALEVMHDILQYDVNPTYWNLTVGDWTRDDDVNYTRPSDFMTDHILAFARHDPANAAKWNKVYDAISQAVNDQFTHGSEKTGLMPDFMVRKGSLWVPVTGQWLETENDGDFFWNACRTPWRLAMSWLTDGRTDMKASQQQTASWIRQKTGGVPGKIYDGYYIKNGPNGKAMDHTPDLVFTAPMTVNAMFGGTKGQAWLDSLWTSITGGDWPDTTEYYGDAVRMQVLLTVSGNWWTP